MFRESNQPSAGVPAPVFLRIEGMTVTGIRPRTMEWQDKGACNEMNNSQYFPERGGSSKLAKAVCESCVVREDCLNYALANGDHNGIWGGFSDTERTKIARDLKRAQRGL